MRRRRLRSPLRGFPSPSCQERQRRQTARRHISRHSPRFPDLLIDLVIGVVVNALWSALILACHCNTLWT